MDGACSTYGMRNTYKILVSKLQGKTPLRRFTCRWGVNIKMKRCGMKIWTWFTCFRTISVTSSCEDSNTKHRCFYSGSSRFKSWPGFSSVPSGEVGIVFWSKVRHLLSFCDKYPFCIPTTLFYWNWKLHDNKFMPSNFERRDTRTRTVY
jgi:hypothetical protein